MRRTVALPGVLGLLALLPGAAQPPVSTAAASSGSTSTGSASTRAALSAAASTEPTRLPEPLGRKLFINSRDPPYYRALDAATQARATLGHAVFNTQWEPAGTPGAARIDGLGPLFNAASCDECHNEGADGRGPMGDGTAPQALVVQLQLPTAADRPIAGDPRYGQELNTAALDGMQPEARVTIHYRTLSGRYPDGRVWQLRDPQYLISGLRYGPLSPQTIVKPRLAPELFGDGLLEAVPDAVILAEGSSAGGTASTTGGGTGSSAGGTVAWQWYQGRRRIGRFGWQGASVSIRDQTTKAFAREMGLTNSDIRHDDCTAAEADCLAQPNGGSPEVSAQLLAAVVEFQRWLAVPVAGSDAGAAGARARRSAPGSSLDSVAPASLFEQIGCAACHRVHLPIALRGPDGTVTTGRISPYTDLRLHDLGAWLADHDASGRIVPSRWRTAPLWGLGYRLQRERQLTLLHDGRALSVEEAILWHGGEASSARQAFEQLPASQRAALLRWVGSL